MRIQRVQPCQREAFIQCWYNAGPASDGRICVHTSKKGGWSVLTHVTDTHTKARATSGPHAPALGLPAVPHAPALWSPAARTSPHYVDPHPPRSTRLRENSARGGPRAAGPASPRGAGCPRRSLNVHSLTSDL